MMAKVGLPETKRCDFCQEPIPIKATRCRHCMSWLSSRSVIEGQGYRVEKERFVDAKSEILGEREVVWIVISDEFLKSRLRYWLNDSSMFLQKEARVPLRSLFTVVDKLRELSASYTRANSNSTRLNVIKPLTDYLEKEFASEVAKLDVCKRDGVISFDLLQHIYCRGVQVLVDVDGGSIGSEILEHRYVHTESGVFFQINFEVIKSSGVALFIQKQTAYISYFGGVKQLSSLNIRPLEQNEQSDAILERGKHFFKVAIGCHHSEYQGEVSMHSEDAYLHFAADGRVMIDTVSFNKMNPSYKTFIDANDNGGSTMVEVPIAIPDGSSAEILLKTWPTVGGFSFYAKRWAEIRVDSLKPLKYCDTAFNDLVMAPELKQMIRAVVTQHTSTSTDVIAGKGVGCVFLLHGPPGVGKTLTAESVAELLHRPLYSVTMGELGTDVVTLEEKLNGILDVAAAWGAVLLLDEADVYLEKRNSSVDIERNGLVCVFLRLLEYYQGMLFLTTNHVTDFDEALFSRISIALEYKVLNRRSRFQIWSNMLRLIGISTSSANTLCSYRMNGRQIRTSLQISQALARSEKCDSPTHNDIERAVRLIAPNQGFVSSVLIVFRSLTFLAIGRWLVK